VYHEDGIYTNSIVLKIFTSHGMEIHVKIQNPNARKVAK